MPDLLRNAYGVRSRYFHTGAAVPPAELLGLRHILLSADAAVSPGAPTDIPSFESLERLTHAVLLAAIEASAKLPGFVRPDWKLQVKTDETEQPPTDARMPNRAERRRRGDRGRTKK